MGFLIGLVVGVVLTVLYRKYGTEANLKAELANVKRAVLFDAQRVEQALASELPTAKADAAKVLSYLKAKL